MKKKLITTITAATAALAVFAGPAAAAPADGQCVAAGVQSLNGAAISGAARAGLVSTVILDHVFDANSLGITPVDC
ncbi:MAG: hypothetical protein R3343_02500 [Nitriliruptorales bacterium]|nr:hypothetical protein [Nitriliruptorales bacterium]